MTCTWQSENRRRGAHKLFSTPPVLMPKQGIRDMCSLLSHHKEPLGSARVQACECARAQSRRVETTRRWLPRLLRLRNWHTVLTPSLQTTPLHSCMCALCEGDHRYSSRYRSVTAWVGVCVPLIKGSSFQLCKRPVKENHCAQTSQASGWDAYKRPRREQSRRPHSLKSGRAETSQGWRTTDQPAVCSVTPVKACEEHVGSTMTWWETVQREGKRH